MRCIYGIERSTPYLLFMKCCDECFPWLTQQTVNGKLWIKIKIQSTIENQHIHSQPSSNIGNNVHSDLTWTENEINANQCTHPLSTNAHRSSWTMFSDKKVKEALTSCPGSDIWPMHRCEQPKSHLQVDFLIEFKVNTYDNKPKRISSQDHLWKETSHSPEYLSPTDPFGFHDFPTNLAAIELQTNGSLWPT